MTRIREIHLWGDGARFGKYLEDLASYLRGLAPAVDVTSEGNLWDLVEEGNARSHAGRIAGGRVFDMYAPLPHEGNDPIQGEIAYEEDRILGLKSSTGILYDGFFLSRCFKEVLGNVCESLASLNIVLSDRLVASFDKYDRRYHARVVLFGFPSVLSITGVVEAPARPREYYLIRRQFQDTGAAPPKFDEEFKSRYLDHDDPRTGEVLKGYALQSLFYQAAGEPFCDVESCRLFNAHWQEEMIHAQLTSSPELCERHGKMLASGDLYV